MAKYQGKRVKKFVPHFRAWLAIAILILISVVLGKASFNIYSKNKIALENRMAAVRELEDLENRQRIIEPKLEKLKTVEGREEEIRKNLPMAKEGEYVITIVDNKTQKASSEVVATSTEKMKPSFWSRWFQ